ncbi:MAG TPA: hypothetical protein VFV86_00155 [Nitrososphaeraceae archaeon]|nr:hypothetical protein [Nitrososphaeraceae archaeon]
MNTTQIVILSVMFVLYIISLFYLIFAENENQTKGIWGYINFITMMFIFSTSIIMILDNNQKLKEINSKNIYEQLILPSDTLYKKIN